MRPYYYDTEHFAFTYANRHSEQAFTIKRKNADMILAYQEHIYKVYRDHDGLPSCIDIEPLFGDNSNADMHIHKIGQIFTPWFKATTDCRQEIEYAIKRFFALESYNFLNLGPDQFALALKNQQGVYDQIIEKLPDLCQKRDTLKSTLQSNYQDKGVSTPRGSTIFDTLKRVWVMSETTQQRPDKPEYFWRVSHLSTLFSPETGHFEFVSMNGADVASNQACFDYIMAAQKKLYGVSPVDLDKVENDIFRLNNVIAQLELILNIPFEKTAVIIDPE